MNINRIEYRKFGKFINREIVFDRNLTIVLGDNEAGKSTLFQSIVDILFGFDPASRDKNPYTNWTHNEINIFAEIHQNGELFEVERRLMSVPKFSLVQKSTSQVTTGRNDPLPWMGKISKDLYKSVYHITAESLNSMEEDSWSEIQDKLIYNYGMTYLNKTSDVLKELDKKINALWRNDRKGAPKINLLMRKKFELERERKNLISQFDYLSQVEQEVLELKESYEITETQYKTLSLKIKEFTTLLPYKEKLSQIERLERRVLDLEFEGNLLKAYEHALENFENASQTLTQMHQSHQEIAGRKTLLDPHEEVLLENASRLTKIEALTAQLEEIDHKLHEHADRLLEHLDKMDQQYMILLGKKATDDLIEQVHKINPFELKNKVQNLMDLEKQNTLHILERKNKGKNTFWLGVFLFASGAVLVFLNDLSTWLPLIGMGFIGFGASNLLKLSGGKKEVLADTETLKNEVRSMMGLINPPDYIWTDSSFVFFLKMEQLLALGVEKEQMEEKRRVLTESYNYIRNQLREELACFNVDSHRNEILSSRMIVMDYERLQKKIEAHEKIDLELSFSDKNIEHQKSKVHSFRETLNAIEAIIERFGMEALENHFESVSRIKYLKEELDEKKDLLDRIQEIEKLEALNEAAIMKFESELEILSDERRHLLTLINEKTSELTHLKDAFDFDAVSDQLTQLNLELQALEKERDVLLISKTILSYSDIQYRLENQPEIIQLVSRYMSIMTNGKYHKVFLDETSETLALYFQIDHEILPLSKAFSKGTINQLFLAFRLAAIHLLDPEGQYPLVLDEALINWDSKRMDRTVQLIEEFSMKRQIIATTCHPDQANRLGKCRLSNQIVL